ncbi:MAG TPA: LysR family transcriptional regulator [Pilimelia sp.]|nr:LysR family transcriptional regulator [Pilimelia sp.]
MDLDTAMLRAFVATAEQHHFGRAAERLFISQQALSKRIHRLEELLGVRLLERTNRRVELTTAGARLLPYAQEAVDAVDAVAASLGIADGPVRVDVMDLNTAGLRLVRRAVERDPTLAVEITSKIDLDSAVPALRRGDVDVVFGRAATDPWPTDVRRRLILLEPIGLLVGVDHPIATRAEVSLRELANLALWFPMAGAPRDWVSFVDELHETYGVTVHTGNPNIGYDHFLDRTAEGPAMATFFGLAMRPPADDRLRTIPIVAPAPVFAWAAMWRRRTPETVVDKLLAGTGPYDLIAAERVQDHSQVWLPAADRAWVTHARRH